MDDFNTLEDIDLEHEAGRSRSKKGGKGKKIALCFGALLLIIIAFFAFKFITTNTRSGYYTVAVFGVDSRNGNVGKDALSDVNIIASVNMETGEIKLASLYRDTYSCISEDGDYHKLNEAYFRGGPKQAVWAVENNTGIKIDDYATFNWKAVVDAINILGGVDLEITDKEFRYINAFITETVNSTGVGSVQLEHSGMNHLDGVQAVAYARLRLMDTDYNRTERQRKVIALAFEKAKNAGFGTIKEVAEAVFPQIAVSFGISDILPYAKNINKYYLGETCGWPFDKKAQDVGKLDCVIPVTLESNAIALNEFFFPDKAFTPGSKLKEISDHIISKTGLGGNGETSIHVDSGNGAVGDSTPIENAEPIIAVDGDEEILTEPETDEFGNIIEAYTLEDETEGDVDTDLDEPIDEDNLITDKPLDNEVELKPGLTLGPDNNEDSSAKTTEKSNEKGGPKELSPETGTDSPGGEDVLVIGGSDDGPGPGMN